MFTYTIVCFGAEIGYGEGESFQYAKDEATEQANENGSMYPESEWGYIAKHPSGMAVEYNV